MLSLQTISDINAFEIKRKTFSLLDKYEYHIHSEPELKCEYFQLFKKKKIVNSLFLADVGFHRPSKVLVV